jgi:transposase InsO family protein
MPAANTPARTSARSSSDHQVLRSIGSVGDAYDNAMAESFVDSFKTELKDRRLHGALEDRPPAEFEALYAARTETSLALQQ